MRAPRLRDHRPFVLVSRYVAPYASHKIALTTSGRRWQGSIEHSSSRSTPCPRIAKSPISPLPLASSPDGRPSLHVANKLKISISLLMRPAGATADGWSRSGFTFSFFFRIPPFAGNEISPKFANSERKGTSNSKNEIPMNSDRNFGDFDRNSVIFDRKIM